jgi:hypothetical protein
MAYCYRHFDQRDLAKPIVDPERSFGNASNDPRSATRLAVIPIVDLRDEGPVHFATKGRARAQELPAQATLTCELAAAA